MPVRSPTSTETSAGGVLHRRQREASPDDVGGLEVCLIATKGGSRWQLPKGHIDAGETPAEAAQREVREETGCTGQVGDELGEIAFWFFAGHGSGRRRVRKSVRFFLVAYVSGDTKDHDGEVDDARWFGAAEAAEKLTFDSERDILVRALERLGVRGGVTAARR